MYNEAEKILLHNDCTRIIKRSSKLCIINDEMNKLFGIKDLSIVFFVKAIAPIQTSATNEIKRMGDRKIIIENTGFEAPILL